MDNKKFKNEYLKFVKSNSSISAPLNNTILTMLILLFLISMGVCYYLYTISLTSELPDIFILPFILVVIAVWSLPVFYFLFKAFYYKIKFAKIKSNLKNIETDKLKKAYIIKSRKKFHTVLTYDQNVSDKDIIEDVKKVKKLLVDSKRLNYKKTYEKINAQKDIKGELKMVDFYSKRVKKYKKDSKSLYQVSFKPQKQKGSIYYGLDVKESNFLLLPASIFGADKTKTRTKENVKSKNENNTQSNTTRARQARRTR